MVPFSVSPPVRSLSGIRGRPVWSNQSVALGSAANRDVAVDESVADLVKDPENRRGRLRLDQPLLSLQRQVVDAVYQRRTKLPESC